jgi:Cu(I)/Ag(I) efflux system membrane fusion protein
VTGLFVEIFMPVDFRSLSKAVTKRPSLHLALRVVGVRLRFPLILIVAFLLIGRWDVLRNYWDATTRAATGTRANPAISSDTEYFCPMDPGILSSWPAKCAICNMGLVRRQKGDAAPLPDGVIARMQLSPYRVQLAGIRTMPVTYQTLERVVESSGVVRERRGSVVTIALHDQDSIPAGASIELVVEDAPGRPSVPAHVALSAESLSLTLDGPGEAIDVGTHVTLRSRFPVGSIEPFRSMPTDPPPRRKGEATKVYVCLDHPEVVREKNGTCPKDRLKLARRDLRDNERLNWWCPMHPEVSADHPGERCEPCGGMALVARVKAFNPKGQVLAVPESAVVRTGRRSVVFVESMPGMFDGVEVELGPRCGDDFPVVKGLEAGQIVALSGAFLLDAETRLNPALAGAYFGASKGTPTPIASAKVELCPVTGKPLGSMGEPVTVDIGGRKVRLCCEGCETPLRKNPSKYLSKLADRPQ